jgi:hypothetical protein
MIPFAGRYCPNVTGHVLTCTCLNCTWREALNCPVWIDFHIYMSGLGLIYLVLLRWSRCTPGLSDWNRVIIKGLARIMDVIKDLSTILYVYLLRVVACLKELQ